MVLYIIFSLQYLLSVKNDICMFIPTVQLQYSKNKSGYSGALWESNSFLHTQGQSRTCSYNNRRFYDWFLCLLSRRLKSLKLA